MGSTLAKLKQALLQLPPLNDGRIAFLVSNKVVLLVGEQLKRQRDAGIA